MIDREKQWRASIARLRLRYSAQESRRERNDYLGGQMAMSAKLEALDELEALMGKPGEPQRKRCPLCRGLLVPENQRRLHCVYCAWPLDTEPTDYDRLVHDAAWAAQGGRSTDGHFLRFPHGGLVDYLHMILRALDR